MESIQANLDSSSPTKKSCSKCGSKENGFYVKDKETGRLSSSCKKCDTKRSNAIAWQSLHNVKGRKRRNRDLINKLKSGPCMDCGNKFPAVCMDFDHRDPSQKTRGVTAMTGQTEEAILAEVAKCDLVCANCHRIRTAKQLGWDDPEARLTHDIEELRDSALPHTISGLCINA